MEVEAPAAAPFKKAAARQPRRLPISRSAISATTLRLHPTNVRAHAPTNTKSRLRLAAHPLLRSRLSLAVALALVREPAIQDTIGRHVPFRPVRLLAPPLGTFRPSGLPSFASTSKPSRSRILAQSTFAGCRFLGSFTLPGIGFSLCSLAHLDDISIGVVCVVLVRLLSLGQGAHMRPPPFTMAPAPPPVVP